MGIGRKYKKAEWEKIYNVIRELDLSPAEAERRLRGQSASVEQIAQNDEFPIFKTVTIGLHKTVAQLKCAVTKAGGRLAPSANDLLTHAKLADEESVSSFVLISASKLGFKMFAKPNAVFEAGYRRGYKSCTPEEVAMLRIATMDQKNGESWIVATAPSEGNDPVEMAFIISTEGDVRLLGNRFRLNEECVASRLFVFKK